jgi:hypothetical protein
MLPLGKTLLPPSRSKAVTSLVLSLKLTWTCLISMPFGAYDHTPHCPTFINIILYFCLLPTSNLNFRKNLFWLITHSGVKGLPIVNPTCMLHHLQHWPITSISVLFMQMTLVGWWVETRDLLHLFKEPIPTIGLLEDYTLLASQI